MFFKFQDFLKHLFLIPTITMSPLFGNNYSLSFDGVDDYTEIPNNSVFESITDELTLQAWVKLNVMPDSEANIISRRNFVIFPIPLVS